MPDLSILIQIAEYYSVDIKEILNGERRNENMDSELKETLLKVADYSELEKEKSLKAGNTAFMLMFSICTIMVIIQMMLTVDLKVVLGETAAAVTGSAAYIFIMVKNGLWESGQKKKYTFQRYDYQYIVCRDFFDCICVLSF